MREAARLYLGALGLPIADPEHRLLTATGRGANRHRSRDEWRATIGRMQESSPPMVSDPLPQFDLRATLDEQLRRAAESLIDAGCVSEIRVHQNGSVITGIVRAEPLAALHAGKHRVYIRRANGSAQLQAECSCASLGKLLTPRLWGSGTAQTERRGFPAWDKRLRAELANPLHSPSQFESL